MSINWTVYTNVGVFHCAMILHGFKHAIKRAIKPNPHSLAYLYKHCTTITVTYASFMFILHYNPQNKLVFGIRPALESKPSLKTGNYTSLRFRVGPGCNR